jgi:uncharacterized membrane protein HdeD (DUF308 family)
VYLAGASHIRSNDEEIAVQLSKLITYSFDPNVGSADRLFRILSGLALAISPWIFFAVPFWATVLLTVFGVAWFITGVVSRCGMYYLLGLSSTKEPNA